MVARYQMFNITSRWYLTPKALAHSNPQLSPLCWRHCGSKGIDLNCWLFCLVLQQFWHMVLADNISTTEIILELVPESLLLGMNHEEEFSYNKWCMLTILLTAAKSSIDLQWKASTLPTQDLWHPKIWEHYN